jgi:hypothetical protein
MLTLAPHQLSAIGEARFQQRLGDLLLESVPDSRRVVDTPEGCQALREQCAKARRYGMGAELDVASYVIAAWLLGLDFDTRFPAMAEVLANDQMTPSQKAFAITQITSVVLAELQKGKR